MFQIAQDVGAAFNLRIVHLLSQHITGKVKKNLL